MISSGAVTIGRRQLLTGFFGGLLGVHLLKEPRKFFSDVHKGLWAHHNKLAPDVV